METTTHGQNQNGVSVRRAISLLWVWTALALAPFCLVLRYLYWPVGHGLDVSGEMIGHDFLNMWFGAKFALAHHAEAIYSKDFMRTIRAEMGAGLPIHVFSYPPHIIALILAFGLLPYFPALAAWSAAGTASVIGVLVKSGLRDRLPGRAGLFALAAAVLSPAAIVNLLDGQNGAFSAALFLGGFYLCETSPAIAGVLFGLLTVKPHLGILVVPALLLRRNWKCIGAAGITSALLLGVSYLLWGLDPWRGYAAFTVPLQSSMLVPERATGYVQIMPGIYGEFMLRMQAGYYGIIAYLLLAVVPALAALKMFWRSGATPRSVLMLAMATIMILPYVFNYDMVAISAAIVAYIAAAADIPLLVYVALSFLWVLPMEMVPVEKIFGLKLPFCSVIFTAAFASLYFTESKIPEVTGSSADIPKAANPQSP